MYCVMCGTPLQLHNQAGLVCLACKQTRGEQRPASKQPVAVQYCFRCGKPYDPPDHSIQHLCCQAGELSIRALYAWADSRATTTQARRHVHVPVVVLSTQEQASR